MQLRKPTSRSPSSSNGAVPHSSTTPRPSQPPPSSTELVHAIDRHEELGIPQHISLFPELSHLEMHFLELVLHKQIQVDKYLIGPSFRDRHRQAFANHLNAGMPLLIDAFIACASLLAGNERLEELAKGQKIGYKRAAAAISSLRLTQIHRGDDLSTVLILGVSLVTFALHHPGSSLPLCRYILGLVKSLFDYDYTLPQRLGPDSAAFLICLLGTETEECLLLCQVPTVRIQWSGLNQFVDRFIGVSVPLLTHFYDICELAQRIRLAGSRRDATLLGGEIQDSLVATEHALENWLPTITIEVLANNFTPIETTLIFSQAKVLRLTALLITHRLRYAYGDQDPKALSMSRAILEELDMVVQLTGKSIPFAELAYLAACFEITKPLERRAALIKSRLIVSFSPHVRGEQEAKLVSFWATRDNTRGNCIFWESLGNCF